MDINRDTIEMDRQRLHLLYQQAEKRCQGWHRCIDDYESDYFLENSGDDDPTVPREQRARLSDIPDAINMGTAILTQAGYRVVLNRPGTLEPDKRLSGMVEGYLRAAVQSEQDRTGCDIEGQMVQMAGWAGAAFVHWAFSPEMGGSRLDMRAPLNAPPIEMWVIDPRRIFPMLGGSSGQFKYLFHVERKSLSDVREFVMTTLAGDSLAVQQLEEYWGSVRPDNDLSTFAEFYDYWGWEYLADETGASGWRVVNAIMYGQAVLRTFTALPGYLVFPWSMAWGVNTGHQEYHRRWLPLHWWMKPHVRAAEREMGKLHSISTKIANMPFVIETSMENPDPPTVLGGDDTIIVLKSGQKFHSPPYGEAPTDLYRLMEVEQDRIERSGLPRALYGMGGQGPQSGYGYEQLQEGGRLRLIQWRNSLAFAFAELFRGIASLVAHFAGPQTIMATYLPRDGGGRKPYKIELTGEDLWGWQIVVDWSSKLPGDEMRDTAQAVQLDGAKLLPKQTIMERYLDVQDPIREMDLIIKETVKTSHPQIAEAYAISVLQEMGAIPKFDFAEQVKLGIHIAEMEAKMRAAGTPEPKIEQFIREFVMTIQMALSQGGNLGGQAPTGSNGAIPQSPPGGTPPEPPRDMGNPQNGVMPHMRGDQPPPGNPQDIGAPLRQQANSMNQPGRVR